MLISDKLWYDMRASEIQADYLEGLRKRIKAEGLDLRGMARIAADLTDAQILNTLLHDKDLQALEMCLADESARERMRFFMGLTQQQIEAMSVEPGAAIELIPQDVLNHALQALNKSPDEVQGRGATICGYKEDFSDKGILTGMSAVLRIPQEDGKATYQPIHLWCLPIMPAAEMSK